MTTFERAGVTLVGSALQRDEGPEDVDVSRLVLDVVDRRRRGLDTRIDGSLIDGTIEQTIVGAPTLSLSVLDPDDELMLSPLFESRVDTELDGVPFRLVKVGRNDEDSLSLSSEHRLVAWMREHTKARKVSRGTMTRAEFAQLLVREIKAGPVRFVCPELKKRQPIAAAESDADRRTSRDERDEERSGGIPAGTKLTAKGARLNARQIDRLERVWRVAEKVNASALPRKAMIVAMIGESRIGEEVGSRGTTFQTTQIPESQLEVQARHFLRGGRSFLAGGAIGLARSNPSLSPGEIASRVEISDRGGSFYNTYADEAGEIMEALGGVSGSSSGGGGGGGRYEFTRGQAGGEREDTWAALGRLADEVQWRRFIVGRRTIYFVADDTLMRSRARYLIDPQTRGVVGKPGFDVEVGRRYVRRRGRLVPRASECTLRVRLDRWAAPPGTVLELADYGPILDGRWLISSIRRGIFDAEAEITLTQPQKRLPEPAAQVSPSGSSASSGSGAGGSGEGLTTEGGAKGLVESIVRIAQNAGGSGVYVVSDFRPGDVVDSGAPSDHSGNNAARAARDIAVRGIDAIVGPPSPKLDEAIVAIGEAFGRSGYGRGTSGPFQSADTFTWRGYRVQLIWRTPKWGGHMGHIHAGARKL